MNSRTLIRMRSFLLLALVQVLIFSRIHLFGYATACVYIIFILKLPRHTTRNELLLWSFFSGLIVDVFCNTPGINAAAAIAMGFMRNTVLATLTHKGMPEDFVPGVKTLKWGGYILYALVCIATFFTILFMLELFTINYPGILLLSTASSTLLTMLFAIVAECLSCTR